MQQHTVAYNEGQPRELQEAIVLRDAISDLPNVLALSQSLSTKLYFNYIFLLLNLE